MDDYIGANLDSAQRVGLLLSIFSPEQREAIIAACCASSAGVRNAATAANEDANHNLEKTFNFLDAIAPRNLKVVLCGATAAIRADRANLIAQPVRLTSIASFFNIPEAELTRGLIGDMKKSLQSLAQAGLADAKSRAAYISAKRLNHATLIMQPHAAASNLMALYYFIGKALETQWAVGDLIADSIIQGVEIGDASAEEGDEYSTAAAREVGDAIEVGAPSDMAYDLMGGGIGGAIGVVASRAIRGWRKRARAKRARKRAAALAQINKDPRLEQDLGTVATSEQPAAAQVGNNFTTALQAPEAMSAGSAVQNANTPADDDDQDQYSS